MIKKLVPFTIIGALLCLACPVRSQEYSVSQGSAAYEELSGAVSINITDWGKAKARVPLGFSFVFLGKQYDSLLVQSSGLLTFDLEFRHAFAAFYGTLGCRRDSNNVIVSSMSYKTTGNNGSRIMKVQFSNCTLDGRPDSNYVNFQVWLYEGSNKLEFRAGAVSVVSAITPLFGLINNSRTEAHAFVLKGDPASPDTESPAKGASYSYLNGIPAEGVIYSFNP